MNSRPPRYRLLALDVDGTLLTSRGRITRRTKQAIRRAMAAGIHVTLATGRALPSAFWFARELGLVAPLVTSDGAVLARPGGKEEEEGQGARPPAGDGGGRPWRNGGGQPWTLLHVRAFDRQLAARVIGDLLETGRPVVVQFPEYLAVSHRPPVGHLARALVRGSFRHDWALRRYVVHLPGDLLARHVLTAPRPPVKISALGSPPALAPVERRILDRYGGPLRLTHSGPGSFDLLPAGTCKAAGLERLAGLLGVDREQVAAIGDNDNDREMLQWAGLGVAMGNAAPPVQQCARLVTRTNDQEGVAEVIERVLLAGGDLPRDTAGGVPVERPS